MADMNTSDDEEQAINYKEISVVEMGNTSVKYSTTPQYILGNGLTTIVYPGYHFGINKPAAVKYIKRQYLRVENDEVNELKIWSEIDQNINIVRLYDSCKDPFGGLYLAMEKAERTFRKQIENCDPNRDEVISWLHQISKAVEYLHGKGVIHRDIKPDNILMFLQDGNRTVAKLADFGVSRMISGLERTGTFSNASGTLLWMAPEAVENQTKNKKFRNTKALDIFGLGMVIYFGLSNGSHPFPTTRGSDEEENFFANSDYKMIVPYAYPKKLSDDKLAANDLLKEMLEREPYKRPKISEVLSHYLFWNWEQEQLFLIRVAICLSKRDSLQSNTIKRIIDDRYSMHIYDVYTGKSFNWIQMGRAKGINITELFFNTRKRKYCDYEYGNGESVTHFLKLFRDKYVHYPEMSPNGAIMFTDNDSSFCEETYVRILTSICPGLSAVLYQVLSQYANLECLHPLRKLYFPWKLQNDGAGNSVYCYANDIPNLTLELGAGVPQQFEERFVDSMQQKRRYDGIENGFD